jgi:hypothetical protein
MTRSQHQGSLAECPYRPYVEVLVELRQTVAELVLEVCNTKSFAIAAKAKYAAPSHS